MSIKKTMVLFLASLSLAGVVSAADDTGERPAQGSHSYSPPAVESFSAEKLAAKAAEYPVGEMKGGFLSRAKMPDKVSYHSFSPLDDKLSSDWAGLLNVEGKGFKVAALAVSAEFKGPKSDAYFGGMFLPHGYTMEAGARMLAFNVALVSAEERMNDVFLHIIDEARKETGEMVPYDFLAVDMLSVEQLHKVKDNPKIYSFSIRPAFSIDGFIVPLHVRGFAAKVDDSYKFLFLLAPDSAGETVGLKGLEIMEGLAGKQE